jgi:hypothetical protein
MSRKTLVVLILCLASEYSTAGKIRKSSYLKILINLIKFNKKFSATYESGLLCYKSKESSQTDLTYKIDCKGKKIFIASVSYENDYDNFCYNKLTNSESSEISKKCLATNSGILRRQCNGRTECLVKLDEKMSFRESDIDANCNFEAQRLNINYECINGMKKELFNKMIKISLIIF